MEYNRQAPYFEAAKSALMNWNGVPAYEANVMVRTLPREEIEGQTYAEGSVKAGARAVAQIMGLTPEQTAIYEQEVLGATPSTEMTDLVRDRFEAKVAGMSPEDVQKEAARIAVASADITHAKWTGDAIGKFDKAKAQINTEKGRVANDQYQYAPSAFISKSQVDSDLLFNNPVLLGADIPVQDDAVREAYYEKTIEDFAFYRAQFPDDYQPTMQELLVAAVQVENGYGLQLPQDVVDRIVNDPELSAAMVAGVYEKGIGGKDPELMDRLVDAGLVREDERRAPIINLDRNVERADANRTEIGEDGPIIGG